jgi:hypothetical protein
MRLYRYIAYINEYTNEILGVGLNPQSVFSYWLVFQGFSPLHQICALRVCMFYCLFDRVHIDLCLLNLN